MSELDKAKLNEKEKRFFVPSDMKVKVKGNSLKTQIKEMSCMQGLSEGGDFPDHTFYRKRCDHPKKGDWKAEISLGIKFRVFNRNEWITEIVNIKDVPDLDIETMGFTEAMADCLLKLKWWT